MKGTWLSVHFAKTPRVLGPGLAWIVPSSAYPLEDGTVALAPETASLKEIEEQIEKMHRDLEIIRKQVQTKFRG